MSVVTPIATLLFRSEVTLRAMSGHPKVIEFGQIADAPRPKAGPAGCQHL
jgi:hypothetical protein